jgi:hypothetical protein
LKTVLRFTTLSFFPGIKASARAARSA